ncbi:MAG: serine protease [Verrucomicrobia bacterium]|nr:serine protease [Verrucomicrobiota bacterium]
MTLIILLFAVGILLLVAEVLVPGGVLGAIGGLMLFGGCVMAFLDFGVGGGLLAVVAALLLGLTAFWLELRVLPRTRIGKRAFLTAEMTGVSAALDDSAKALVGKPATALTLLSPSGYVRIDGQRYEAFCQSGQAPAGADLEVIGADNFRLIVSQTPSAS